MLFLKIMIIIDLIAIVIISCYVLFKLNYIYINTAKIKGDIGEFIVKWHIGKTNINNSYYVINDITITIEDTTAQIDHIIICRSGIYVIETKNYKGYIYANEYDYEWVQNIYGNKYYFYSPYLQNRTHCKRIAEILGTNDNIFNVIVFIQNNVNKKYCKSIYYLDELKEIKNNEIINLSDEQCKEYYNKILNCQI